jgi:NTP pyrophosphatase (non-canonical NTP hydrolase)
MNFEEIEQLVIKWAEDRAIFTGSNASRQFIKLYEEQGELLESIVREDYPNVRDSIGDMIVVLTMIAKFYGTNLKECYEQAYNEIKDRRGKMINGIFVKES